MYDGVLNVSDMYMAMLSSLSDDDKLDLISRLSESIRNKVKGDTLYGMYGIWANDAEMDNIEQVIKEGRAGDGMRKIESFD